MTNRLRPIIAKIISPFQTTFVPGRSIHDNILLTREIMHKFKRLNSKHGWAALTLDMEKAYDRLEWDFIIQCLQELGFHPQWISWTKECLTIVSFSILVNGEPCGLFTPTRGIRQGDPLSPFIFIICMEALTYRLLQKANQPKSGLRVKVCPRNSKIPCLLFADECLIFSKTSSEAYHQLKNLLDEFCTISG